MKEIAEVNLQCGRYNLTIAGIIVAMEGDTCRHGDFPEEVLEPISEIELKNTYIGGKCCADMDIDIVRLFRGKNWSEKLLRYTADKINEAI